MAKKKLTFEQAMERLQEIVDSMQNSQISLQDSIGLYKEGITLSQICAERLNCAEQEISVLSEISKGNFIESPLENIKTERLGDSE